MKEKPSLLKNIRTSWDIINLGWNVVRFRGGGRTKRSAAW